MPNEAGEQNQGKTPETTTEADLPGPREGFPARRPYVTPKLTRLGAVRDLTFGAVGTVTESLTPRLTPGKAPPRH
jgi:hypothetical protein